jgi:hypothetical protein
MAEFDQYLRPVKVKTLDDIVNALNEVTAIDRDILLKSFRRDFPNFLNEMQSEESFLTTVEAAEEFVDFLERRFITGDQDERADFIN